MDRKRRSKEDCSRFYSGSDSYQNVVGLIVNKRLTSSVSGFIPMSDRIAMLRLKSDKITLNVNQVYAATADPKYDDKVENFYEELEQILSNTKSEEVTVVMGDLNAKVGNGRIG